VFLVCNRSAPSSRLLRVLDRRKGVPEYRWSSEKAEVRMSAEGVSVLQDVYVQGRCGYLLLLAWWPTSRELAGDNSHAGSCHGGNRLVPLHTSFHSRMYEHGSLSGGSKQRLQVAIPELVARGSSSRRYSKPSHRFDGVRRCRVPIKRDIVISPLRYQRPPLRPERQAENIRHCVTILNVSTSSCRCSLAVGKPGAREVAVHQ
jgi:hypothetical protein